MKKCLTICILLFSMVLNMLPVCAESSPVFGVEMPIQPVKAGDAFEVSVKITNNPGFCAIGFALSYDDSLMKCDDVLMEDILSDTLAVANPEKNSSAIVSSASLKPVKSDGVLARFLFTAKEDIDAFKFSLKDIVLADVDGTAIDYKIEENVDEEDDSSDSGEVVNPNPEDVFVDNSGSGSPGHGGNFNEDVSAGIDKPNEDAEEETVPTTSFADVAGHWAEKYVGLAAKEGLFLGDTDGNFKPDDNVTRAQFVTVLWRMAGRPDVDAELPFTDVEKELPEFKSAIRWGYANGYIKGTSGTTFEPGASLTREAGMKILHSYSGGKIGKEIQLYAVYDGTFKDSAEISDWAKPSVYWGIYNKLISGTSSDTLTPKGTATRAQLATILVNYLDIK